MKYVAPLSFPAIKKLNKDGLYALGGVPGLSLKIQNSKKTYVYRYRNPEGRRRIMSLGQFDCVSLSEARAMALSMMQKLSKNVDPLFEKDLKRQKHQANRTFEAVTKQWLELRDQNHYYSNPREPIRILACFKKNLFPKIGNMHIDTIEAKDLYDALGDYWVEHPASASKLITWTKQVFKFAIAMKLRKERTNPADQNGDLGVLLEDCKKKKEKHNMPALPVSEIPSLFVQLDSLYSSSARAIEFAILTAARSQAVRLAKWRDIDLENGVWEVPPEDDKVKTPGRDRTIYLSSEAIKLLERIPHFPNQEYVFVSNRGFPFSNMALQMLLRRLHESKFELDGIGWIDPVESEKQKKICPVSLHGTARATFFTWATDDNVGNNKIFDRNAVDKCLLHGSNDPYNGAYDRSVLADERKKIMEAWGQYCYSKVRI